MLTSHELDQLAQVRLVIVADNVVLDPSEIGPFSREIDRTEARHTNELRAEVIDNVKDVVVYNDPRDFIDAIASHKNDIVLPDWTGSVSRSRTGLVPAICETYGVRYVGADAYTKIVCHDKLLAKSLCVQAGFSVPRAILIDRAEKLPLIETITRPYIIKPCYEGSSIGIDEHCIAETPSMAASRALYLLGMLNSPVLVEEFCPGKEVSLCLLGTTNNVKFFEAGERYLPADEDYFETHAFTFELKKNSKRTNLRRITDNVPNRVKQAAFNLFNALDKAEILRIDGRLSGEYFNVIELTPETHLGARAEYCGTFIRSGMSYKEILLLMLANALDTVKHQAANRQT